MKIEDVIKNNNYFPIIETNNLYPFWYNKETLPIQISRWSKSGKLIKLKNGIYLLPDIYRKIEVFEYYTASILIRPSYISLQKALEYYGLIPEGVPVYTSLTTKRMNVFTNVLGAFKYQHIKPSLFWGYTGITVNKQTAFIALPEKALLDYIYINKIELSDDYLSEMRLQNTEQIDCQKLALFAKRFNKPGIIQNTHKLIQFIQSHKKEVKSL